MPLGFLVKTGGHRLHWRDCVKRKFDLDVLVGWKGSLLRLLREPGSVIFLSADDHFVSAFAVSFARAVRGRSSSLVILSAERTVRPRNWRNHIKRLFFRMMKPQSIIELVAILPFEVEPSLRLVCHRSVPDLNFFDLSAEDKALAEKASRAVRGDSSKLMVGAFGRQTARRGTELLLKAYCSSVPLRQNCQIQVAGPFDGIAPQLIAEAKGHGAHIVDGFLEFDQMLASIKSCDFVWAVYAPEYDQSSGVFGHAFQLAVPCLVRRGSQLGKLAKALDTPSYEIEYSVEEAARLLEVSNINVSGSGDGNAEWLARRMEPGRLL